MATLYGTAFEQLSDEERDAITKKPKVISEEVVTDEKGRRRFHGAFTGGFSAGYFNTAGSKHGWVPQTFKSSRESRAENTGVSAEDFMDEEDLGEFGIAAKKLRTRSDFMDFFSRPGESNLLAWERSTNVLPSTSTANEDDSVTSKLSELLRPLNDSIGVRLLKKMGWREGKGIGMRMSRRALEKQKVIDAVSRGEAAVFDEEAVAEVENRAHQVDFAPDDIPALFFNSKENVHGLGYNPLQEKNVLVQNYGVVAKGLQTSKKGKAIRGQAFGVGAFEEDDEDIYTSYDLSQYDFEIGQSASSGVRETARFDSTFVPAKKSASSARKFFAGIKPPSNFRPVHKPIKTEMVQGLPSKILQLGDHMTPFQRAKFLGDRDQSVMELLTEKDRNFLSNLSAEREKAANLTQKPRPAEYEPFEEEPIKAHRFKKYVSYLKRGIYFEQPVELTRLEWGQQLAEFQNALTPELRSLLPEVRSRQQPLAKIDFAQPIAEQLNSRFQKESNEDYDKTKITKDHDLIQAIKMNMFGKATRKKFKWHPHKDLCKRFNVPNPYPDSADVGVPELQKRIKSSMNTFAIMNTELRTTQQEIQSIACRSDTAEAAKTQLEDSVIKATLKVEEGIRQEKAPWELLKALFENDDSSSEDENDIEEDIAQVTEISIKQEEHNQFAGASKKAEILIDDERPSTSRIFKAQTPKTDIVDEVITVLDLVEDEDVFGPALPPTTSQPFEKNNGTAESSKDQNLVRKTESLDSDKEMSEEKHKRSRKDSKTKKAKKHKDSKKHKESKKQKKKKSKKRKHKSSSSESSGVEVIERSD